MKLEDLLLERRSAIIKKWRDAIIKTYPEDTQRFLKKEKDRFSNPVGYTIGHEIETLYDEIVKGGESDRISPCLDNMIRIRAVQDFRPSQAVGFVLHLKSIIREELAASLTENGLSGELLPLENRIDDIALLAFDIYSQRRQKICEIRVNEVRNQVSGLLRRADLICEIPEGESDP